MKKVIQFLKKDDINIKYKQVYKIPKVYIFLCYLLLNLLIYGPLCRKHYATDSYQIYFTGVSGTLLWSGRIAAYFLSKIYTMFNLNVIEVQGWTTMMAIIVMSITASFLFLTFYNKIKKESLSAVIIIFLSSLLATTNFFVLEWFLFPEEVLFYAVGMLIASFGAYKWSCEKDTVANFVIVSLYLLFSMYMYQMNMNVYIILSLIFIGIDYNFNVNFKSVKKVIMTFFVCLFSGILSIITNKLVEVIAKTEIRASFSFSSIINNTLDVIANQKNVWINGMGLMKYPWLLCFAIIMVGLISYILMKQKKQMYMYIILMFIVDFIIIFNPNYIANIGICMSPRVLIGLPYFLSVMPITLLHITEKSNTIRYNNIVIAVLLLLLVPNIATMQNVITDHFATNKLDEEYAYLIGKVIDNYEKENDVEVKYIARVNDKVPSYKYEWIDYMGYDVNTRAFMWDWSDIYIVNKITNKDLKIKEMDSQIYDQYFKDKDWNYFNPHEQLIFEGDTLYWCKY